MYLYTAEKRRTLCLPFRVTSKQVQGASMSHPSASVTWSRETPPTRRSKSVQFTHTHETVWYITRIDEDERVRLTASVFSPVPFPAILAVPGVLLLFRRGAWLLDVVS